MISVFETKVVCRQEMRWVDDLKQTLRMRMKWTAGDRVIPMERLLPWLIMSVGGKVLKIKGKGRKRGMTDN